MTKIITIGNQKGGVGKTTTSSCLSWILSMTYRVLIVDMDMQANSTSMISVKPYHFFNNSNVVHAMKTGDAEPYIYKTNLEGHNLDLLPSSESLALFKTNDLYSLDRSLKKVSHNYDFIFIDTPPDLDENLASALLASTHVIGMMQAQPLSLDAMSRFLNHVRSIRDVHPNLQLLGILIAMFETDNDSKGIAEEANELYGKAIFNTKIKKRTRLRRMSRDGISMTGLSNMTALKQYRLLAKELIERG